jgi:hypothetical protein
MPIWTSSGVGKVPWIDCASHMLPYEQPSAFVRTVSEFVAEPHLLLTSSSRHTVQNVALDAR